MASQCSGVPCSYRSRKARGSKVTVEITTEADTSSRAGWPSASLRDIRDAALIEALDAASFELGTVVPVAKERKRLLPVFVYYARRRMALSATLSNRERTVNGFFCKGRGRLGIYLWMSQVV